MQGDRRARPGTSESEVPAGPPEVGETRAASRKATWLLVARTRRRGRNGQHRLHRAAERQAPRGEPLKTSSGVGVLAPRPGHGAPVCGLRQILATGTMQASLRPRRGRRRRRLGSRRPPCRRELRRRGFFVDAEQRKRPRSAGMMDCRPTVFGRLEQRSSYGTAGKQDCDRDRFVARNRRRSRQVPRRRGCGRRRELPPEGAARQQGRRRDRGRRRPCRGRRGGPHHPGRRPGPRQRRDGELRLARPPGPQRLRRHGDRHGRGLRAEAEPRRPGEHAQRRRAAHARRLARGLRDQPPGPLHRHGAHHARVRARGPQQARRRGRPARTRPEPWRRRESRSWSSPAT